MNTLAKLRNKNNLTQGEMAEKLFVTRQAVSRWETGETIPSIDTLRLISKIFDVSINSLIETPTPIGSDILCNGEINAERFLGFADIYENARPKMSEFPAQLVMDYLGRMPENVVDLGCGTGLSTLIWEGKCSKVVGVDPSHDMLAVASEKSSDTISFKKGFSDKTGLEDNFADVVICSQSFHWMNPELTLREVARILKHGGVFATVDCDWPPVCNWKAENAYSILLNKVRQVESGNENVSQTFNRWDKRKHLDNIKVSGYFRFSREIVFSNSEKCDAKRFINLALSQGGLQTILKLKPELILMDIEHFKKCVFNILGDSEFEIKFSYRMRVGVK